MPFGRSFIGLEHPPGIGETEHAEIAWQNEEESREIDTELGVAVERAVAVEAIFIPTANRLRSADDGRVEERVISPHPIATCTERENRAKPPSGTEVGGGL